MILPVLFLQSVAHASAQKISSRGASEIIRFSLFNYDNLIADHYEKTNDYIGQLAYLLYKNTHCPTENFISILNSEDLNHEPNPVQYLVVINKKTKAQCGYYFLDD